MKPEAREKTVPAAITAEEARILWSLTGAHGRSGLGVRAAGPAAGVRLRRSVAGRARVRLGLGSALAVGGGELGATGPDLARQAVADHPEEDERTEGHHDPDERAHPGGADRQLVDRPERHPVDGW